MILFSSMWCYDL